MDWKREICNCVRYASGLFLQKYADIIKQYEPFLILTVAQNEVFEESYRNNHKHEMRAKRKVDIYGYEDDMPEQFHRELISDFYDPVEKAEEIRRLSEIKR